MIFKDQKLVVTLFLTIKLEEKCVFRINHENQSSTSTWIITLIVVTCDSSCDSAVSVKKNNFIGHSFHLEFHRMTNRVFKCFGIL